MESVAQSDLAYRLLEALFKGGVRDVVVSPGSRNAPIMIALVRYFADFRIHSVVDERSAGYKAIGISDITNAPVALVCTSGTAAANYLSAVTEAWFRSVPLVVVTADRPERLTTARDGQTIFQHRLYGKHADAFFSLSNTMSRDDIVTTLAEIYTCTASARRPIHVNVHFDEPLYRISDPADLPLSLPDPIARCIDIAIPDISGFQNIMIAAGQMKPGEIPEDLQIALDLNGFLLVSGGLSNLHPMLAIMRFNQIDARTLPQPDLVITIGGEITHKALKQYLRTIPHLTHWHVEDIPYAPDTFGKGATLFQTDSVHFLKKLLETSFQPDNAFSNAWRDADLEAEATLPHTLDPECSSHYHPVAEAARQANALIVLGNSAVVRQYLKLPRIYHQNLYGNRGTAGIDGSLSSAVGMAMATTRPVWCLLGDLSFFYDSNALWQVPLPENLTIFVFNNFRGKIFEMIPGPGSFPEIYTLQATPHNFTCRHIAAHYAMKYIAWQPGEYIDLTVDLRKTVVEIFV